MKPLTAAIAIAVLALPLCAADQQKPSTNTNTTTTTLSAPVSQEQTDSPLVRAAKATGRLNKKPGFVITNETLLRTGGHIGIASQTQQAPLPSATPAGAPARGTAPRPQQPDMKARTDAEAKQRAMHQATSDYYGENADQRHDDPAQQERQMQQTTTTQAPAKPPLN